MEFIDLNIIHTVLNDTHIYANNSEYVGEQVFFSYIGIPAASIAAAIGLITNILLIIAVRKSPRLKAPIFQLLFSIAFADIILLIAFGLPEAGGMIAKQTWIFGSTGCRVLLFLQFLPSHVTSCLIVVCCWERFYAVCRPHSAIWITSRKMSGIIAITWLLNAGVLAPLIVMTKDVTMLYAHRPDDFGVQTCRLDMPPDVKKLYFTVIGMLFYGITAIVSVAFLSCTICKALKIDLENYFIKDDFKNHIVKCVAAITVTSIVLWIPYRYVYFYNLHTPQSEQNDNKVVSQLGIFSILFAGSIKPLIYVSASSQFRKSVFRAIKCCHSKTRDFEFTHGYKMSDRMNVPEGVLIT